MRARPERTSLVVLASGAGAALGQAPFDLPALGVLALVTFFWIMRREVPVWTAARRGWWFGAGYFVVTMHWIVEPFLVDIASHGWMAPFALVFLAIGLALFWGAAAAVAARLGGGGVTLALTLTGAELLRAYVLTGFPWGLVSYGLVASWPGQLAAWIGPHGLTLLLLATAAILADGMSRHRVVAIGAALGVAGLVQWPMPAPSAPTEGARVRLVQPNAPQHLKWMPGYIEKFYRRAYELTPGDGAPVDLVVWPETSVPTLLGDAGDDLATIRAAAGSAFLVAGLRRLDGLRLFNSAAVVAPDGSISQVYDKFHLVPFGEYLPLGSVLSWFGLRGLAAEDGNGFAAGAGPKLLDLGKAGRALPLICYEMVFPQHTRPPERPDFILQLTNDAWFGNFSGPFQHLVQAQMRAIETGLPVVRAANTGVSAVIDASGHITASLPLNTAGFLDATVPAPRRKTVYARTGDLPLALMLVIIGLVGMLRRRGKTR